MPIHIKTIGAGRMSGGRIEGTGERYEEDSVTGESTVLKGTFVRGRLHGAGIKIVVQNTSFTYYSGPFVNGVMSGDFKVLDYVRIGPPTEEESKLAGNSECGTRNRCHVYNSVNNELLSVRCRMIRYLNGEERLVLSDGTEACGISVSQKTFNSYKFFNDVCIILGS